MFVSMSIVHLLIKVTCIYSSLQGSFPEDNLRRFVWCLFKVMLNLNNSENISDWANQLILVHGPLI
jgi:hypothetical protein